MIRLRDPARRPRRSPSRLAVALAAFLASAAGCARPPAPVDAPLARRALVAALDGWRKGDAPAALRGGSPALTVQDLDWMGGAKLLSYEIAGAGREAGSNLYIPARLTLRTPQGKEVRRDATSVVGTSPILTVFRSSRRRPSPDPNPNAARRGPTRCSPSPA